MHTSSIPSAYPRTRVNAGGASDSSQALRRARRSSPVSRRTSTTNSAVPISAPTLAMATTAAPSPMPGSQATARAARGNSGKNRNAWWPKGR